MFPVCTKCGKQEFDKPVDKGACGYPVTEYCNFCFEHRHDKEPIKPQDIKFYEDTNPKYGDSAEELKSRTEIAGVAIKYKNLVICLPKPNRHCDVIKYMVEVLHFPIPIKHHENPQGFYTTAGEFLDRKQAMARVKEIKQPIIDRKEELFSEDLW